MRNRVHPFDKHTRHVRQVLYICVGHKLIKHRATSTALVQPKILHPRHELAGIIDAAAVGIINNNNNNRSNAHAHRVCVFRAQIDRLVLYGFIH